MCENRHRSIERILKMGSCLDGIGRWAKRGMSRDKDDDDEVNQYLCTTFFALCV